MLNAPLSKPLASLGKEEGGSWDVDVVDGSNFSELLRFDPNNSTIKEVPRPLGSAVAAFVIRTVKKNRSHKRVTKIDVIHLHARSARQPPMQTPKGGVPNSGSHHKGEARRGFHQEWRQM